jgi:hypothetical protein
MLITFGLRYVFASKAMPYHLVAMGRHWNEIDDATKAILLALIHCAGAAYLAVSAASLWIVLAALIHGTNWANPALVTMYVVLLVPVTHAMQQVRRTTPGRPPISASVIGLSMALLAYCCEWLS